jgi:predicted anti-sigma-YlaC factor YlaD
MTGRPDDALGEHARECEACRADAPPLAQLRALLAAGDAAPDAGRLSDLARARLGPELQRRAQAVFWRRFARVLGIALLPLPVVLAADVWLLGWLYQVAAAWLPSTLAVYIVCSYAASALAAIGVTYAAIPLLIARPVHAHEFASV